jgi:putative Holliday junction resolvase
MSAIRGRLLGIDHGVKRIGLAVSDRTGLLARELRVIERRSKAEDFRVIAAIAAAESVIGLIVGLPRNLDLEARAPGTYTQADTVARWLDALRAAVPLPARTWDETMSSVDAAELARARRRRWDEPIDDLAARVILQSYLDAVRDGLAEPFPPADVEA